MKKTKAKQLVIDHTEPVIEQIHSALLRAGLTERKLQNPSGADLVVLQDGKVTGLKVRRD